MQSELIISLWCRLKTACMGDSCWFVAHEHETLHGNTIEDRN